ncbi:Glycosyltransferase involved in cell wall bisynthesis [Flavobacteriaceae bacterium MAR_2010_188]|nr:Glycosyltransferase involved in cell wall bisynthesis [Flavobacteriaceae bacterium MAR_2010_188]
MKKLAIVTTHPIQYYAPWFRLMSQRNVINLKVFYTWSQAKEKVKDKTFGQDISWDIPLLKGYEFEFIENISTNPGSHHFRGIICPDLIPAIKKYNPDAILIFGWNFVSHLKVMRYFKNKIPIWFRGDSTLLDDRGGYKTLLRRLFLTLVYRYVDKALYVGTANRKYFRKHGLKPDQLELVPHAIDNERFGDNDMALNNKAAIWRLSLGYSNDDMVVLFAGKFEDKKQPHFLIEVIKSANLSRDKPLKLLLLGAGPLEKSLFKMAESDSNITFLPFQNQSKMPIVYRLGDITCLPSKGPGETWGLAVNESMASGRPAIVSDKVGCSQDLIKNNINGFIFNHNSKSELEGIFIELNKKECRILGEQAQKDIQFWSYTKQIDSIVKVLKYYGHKTR